MPIFADSRQNRSTLQRPLSDPKEVGLIMSTHMFTYADGEYRSSYSSIFQGWPAWLNGRVFARDPKGRGLESRPVRFQVTALGKLLTRMCLCHQAV